MILEYIVPKKHDIVYRTTNCVSLGQYHLSIAIIIIKNIFGLLISVLYHLQVVIICASLIISKDGHFPNTFAVII